MAGRDAFAVVRARLDALGFRPSSTLGQNFLLDPSLHRWIAEQAELTGRDTAIEIGAGLGFLTRELTARAGRVVAVEIDGRLLGLARADLAACANVQWVHGNALAGVDGGLHPDIVAAASAATGRLALVANLPYAASGPLLAGTAGLPRLPERCVLLVQKELAQRLAARAGTPDYGGLSALLQALYTVRTLRDVPPQVFRPRPKVVSSVVQFDLRADAALVSAPGDQRARFARFLRHLFQQRRKVLRTTLPAAAAAVGRLPPPLAGAELALRAEAIAPDTLVQWWLACPPGPAGAPGPTGAG
ncbi:MAG: 16S rRNA (adenine(1518)-N(6)/adenine(1519)-N(6))-dimethyltransferase RsmA [Planctomycetota bacterium]